MAKIAKKGRKHKKTRESPLGHQAFVNFICDPNNSKTYNRAKYAYMAAYPNATPLSAKSSGCRLLTFDTIKRAIEVKRREIAEINSVDSNFVKGEHLRLLDESEAKGDLATATRNVEGLARAIGAYKEVSVDFVFDGHRPPADPVAESERFRREFVESQVVSEGGSKASSLPKRVVPKDAPVQVDAPQKKPEKPTGRSDTFLIGEPSTVKVDTPQDVSPPPVLEGGKAAPAAKVCE